MSGTLFGLALSQQIDVNGTPLSGAKLYVYEGGTSTPADVYEDTGLTNLHPWPLEADSNGRIPQFWLDDGTYRARLTNSAGTLQFDTDSILAIGPSSGGGGGGGTVDEEALFQTGDPLWVPKTGTRSGWVRLNGRTVGSAASGATERANADVQSLYEYLWATYSDTYAPVTGGRGASAAADWAANKPMGLLDMRGRGAFGLDDMGNSAATRLANTNFYTGNTTTAAAVGGADGHVLATSEMPSHTHTATVTDPGHAHAATTAGDVGALAAGGATINGGGGGTTYGVNTTVNVASGGTNVTVANSSTGGGGAHNNMPPFMLGTWYQKL